MSDTGATTLEARRLVIAVALALVVSLGAFAMHPRISVTDGDAYSYIGGAYSLQAGRGYTDLNGYALYVEPPGYSALLACFRSPLRAALVVNDVALLMFTSVMFLLLEDAGWSRVTAAGFALALGFGFFRGIAMFAKPDILNYALFLIGARGVLAEDRRWRVLGGCLWGLLTPLKLVSVVFVPALLVTDYFLPAERRRFSLPAYALIGGVWMLGVASLLTFNYLRIGTPLRDPLDTHLVSAFGHGIVEFFYFIPREFLTTWYGSIRSPLFALAVAATLIVAVRCMFSLRLRADGRRALYLGVAMFLLTWVLLLKWHFDTNPRITGYGLILALLAFRPLERAERYWIAYAAVTVLVAFANAWTTNSLGANDPRYAAIARQVASAQLPPRAEMLSNSEHLLDVLARIPSLPAHHLSEVPPGALLTRVNLPSFDAVGQMTWPIEEPPHDWQVVARFEHATVYRRPASPDSVSRGPRETANLK